MSTPATEISTAKVDPNSRTWRAVKDRAENRIKIGRATVDARGIDERDADFERGRIAAMNEILALQESEQG